jgi:chromate transporter
VLNPLKVIEVFLSMAKVGVIGFGGGNSMIILLEQEVVHSRHWMALEQYKEIIGYSYLAPGLSAGKIAAYAGWVHAGLLGMLAGILGIWLPGMLMMFLLIFLLKRFDQTAWYPKLRDGILFAAAGLIAASITSALPALPHGPGATPWVRYALGLLITAVVCFVLVRYKQVPPVLAVLGAGIVGLLVL